MSEDRIKVGAGLKGLLAEKKDDILKTWLSETLDTYPADTVKYLKGQDNQFANPVGHTISGEIANIYDCVLNETAIEQLSESLDNIIRIRAVQDFSASQAVAFVFKLKDIVRGAVKKQGKDETFASDLLAFDSMIDEIALFSFDIYMKCREKLYDIKANELKRMTYRLVQKANMMPADSDEDAGHSSADILNEKTKRGN